MAEQRKVNITIEEIDGVEKVYVNAVFDLGEIKDERKAEEGVIYTGVNISGIEDHYKQMIYERCSGGCEFEKYDELLEQYVQFRIMSLIGVTETPIKRDKEGKLVGFSDEPNVERTLRS